MGISDYLTCHLRNLYAGQEAIVKSLYGADDLFKIEKGVQQGCLLSPSLFNLYAEHIMRNTRLDESQVGIKISGRNNNLRRVNITSLMTESEEELKSLLMMVEILLMRVMKEESEKAGLELYIKKKKR